MFLSPISAELREILIASSPWLAEDLQSNPIKISDTYRCVLYNAINTIMQEMSQQTKNCLTDL